ncbi:MAG: hypothetical protein N2327_02675 [Caldimicrobium sp.]|nr:hypothetical protein [Caldimicrobium sp.]MCX7873325.1 hypothetical protein [Caldimicrobium sp.]MDW8093437.1 hypothetical protein [Caldimicrobium sp.]
MSNQLKKLILVWICGLLLSCSQRESISESVRDLKENLIEETKVYLASLPVINRWIKLPKPPQELYRDTEAKIATLRVSKASDLFPQEYNEIMKNWESAKEKYDRKLYKSSEKILQRVNRDAGEILKKIEAHERALKEQALARYKEKERELLARLSKNEEERLKIKLYLWKLRNLIELGRLDEFERELQRTPL